WRAKVATMIGRSPPLRLNGCLLVVHLLRLPRIHHRLVLGVGITGVHREQSAPFTDDPHTNLHWPAGARDGRGPGTDHHLATSMAPQVAHIDRGGWRPWGDALMTVLFSPGDLSEVGLYPSAHQLFQGDEAFGKLLDAPRL